MQTVYIILTILSLWLVGVTVLGFYIFNYFRNLSRGTTKENIISILERAIAEQSITRGEMEKINDEIAKIKDLSQSYLQKVGFLRFNPFEELGGDHSFSLALLDAKDSGIIITGLHTRERTRVYVKNIKRGKAELELSVEEKKVLRLAQKI